jgi:hypothetical protein
MKVTRQSRHYHGGMADDRLLRMIEIIIESGALYVFIQIIFVVLFLAQNPAQNIVVAAAVQIYVRIFHFRLRYGLYMRLNR